MKLNNLCLFVLTLILLSGVVSAKNGFIEGHIYDSALGEPIDGVEIRMHYSANGEYTYNDATTDDNGYFGIKSPSKEDTYYLICIAAGYGYQKTDSFKTDSQGNIQNLEFKLKSFIESSDKAYYTSEISNKDLHFRAQIIGPKDPIEYGNSYNYKVRVTALDASNPQTKLIISYSDDCVSLEPPIRISASNKKGIKYDITLETNSASREAMSWIPTGASALGILVPDDLIPTLVTINSIMAAGDIVTKVGEWNKKNTIKQPEDPVFYDDNSNDIASIAIPNPLKAANGEDVYWRDVEVTIPMHFELGVTEPRLYFWVGCMDSAGGGTFWDDTNDDPASPFEIKPNELSEEAIISVVPEEENKITELAAVRGQLTDVTWPTKDIYDHTEQIPVDVNFENTGSEARSYWVGYSVQDPAGKWWDAPPQPTATIQPGESGTILLQCQPPEETPEGAYNAKVALWVGYNSYTGLMEGELDSRTKENAFQLTSKESANSESWNKNGLALKKQGKYDEAIKAYDEAIRLDPNYADAWNNKGVALLEKGKYDEAIKAIDEAIRLDPNNANAWNNKGGVLVGQGKYDEAIKAIDEAIRLDPNNANAWSNKGGVLVGQGKYDEANKAIDEAIRLDPNNANAWNNKNVALLRLGDSSDAEVALTKARELGYKG